MNKTIPVFFIALGVVLGGSFIGSIGGLLIRESPLKIMASIADDIKLYAIICAIGGTFTNLRLLEGVLFRGNLMIIFELFFILLSAFLGAQLGYWLIIIFCGGK
ncbi:MAG TPA: YtrH family sporulation protein [Halanaerobiales bacterium]|nr:YtrH family sporulation protein [Halanaerobiales bacterium]